MPRHLKGVVLAIGIFDGVHRGHQAILKKAMRIARRLKAHPAVLTFPAHPSRILSPGSPVPLIQTFRQRSDAIRSVGIRRIYPLQFTKSLSRLSPERFVVGVLFRKWNLRGVVVGENFRFGRNRSGTVATLRRLLPPGCGVWPVRQVRLGRDLIQSTVIRSDLAAGRIDRAQSFLGRPVELIGRSERGAGLGGKTGARTINLSVANELLPKFGVYAGWFYSGNSRRPTVMNLGVAPTLRKSRKVLLEVHVLDRKRVAFRPAREHRVELKAFLRPERKFPSMARLKQAIRLDIGNAGRILKWKKR